MKKEAIFSNSAIAMLLETSKLIYSNTKNNKINTSGRKSLIKRIQYDLLKYKEFENYPDWEYGSKYCMYYGMLGNLYKNLNIKKSAEFSKSNRLKALLCSEGYWLNLRESDKTTYWGLNLVLDIYGLNIDLGNKYLPAELVVLESRPL